MTPPTNGNGYIFLKIGPKDAAAVADLERRCFDLSWGEKLLRAALSQKAFSVFALKRSGVLAAFAMVYHAVDELEIVAIAVRPEDRRRGLAGRLLGLVLREAGKRGIVKSVLEVRPSNAAAIALYAAHGYRQAGIRPGYYSDTGEDALVYIKEFSC
jgi:ribosomal-protein-alanine N-acetyltransferase